MRSAMNSIYTMQPINKTAAVVTNQAGCSESLSDEQLKESLSARATQLVEFIRDCGLPKKHPERKAASEEYHELTLQLREIRSRIKVKPRGRDICPFFLLVAKSNLTKYQYEKIYNEAIDLAEKYNYDTDKMKTNHG